MANSSFQKSSIATPVAIADGGTGATTQATALDAIADSSSGSADQVLTTDGTNASWEDAAGGGFTSQFRVYRGTNQTISDTAWNKIQFNTESFDTGSEYDNATNYRFTPTDAGYYQLNLHVYFSNLASDELYQISIYKNGAQHSTDNAKTNTYGATNLMISDVVYSDGDDYFEFYVRSLDGAFYVQSGASESFASGFRVA